MGAGGQGGTRAAPAVAGFSVAQKPHSACTVPLLLLMRRFEHLPSFPLSLGRLPCVESCCAVLPRVCPAHLPAVASGWFTYGSVIILLSIYAAYVVVVAVADFSKRAGVEWKEVARKVSRRVSGR